MPIVNPYQLAIGQTLSFLTEVVRGRKRILEAPNPVTLRWYYDVQELLAAADIFPRDRVDPANPDARARWRAAHSDEPPLPSGLQMRMAVAERFDVGDVHGCAYLYRYITKHLPADPRGVAIAQHLYNTERRNIADGTFAAVGLGIVASRRGGSHHVSIDVTARRPARRRLRHRRHALGALLPAKDATYRRIQGAGHGARARYDPIGPVPYGAARRDANALS